MNISAEKCEILVYLCFRKYKGTQLIFGDINDVYTAIKFWGKYTDQLKKTKYGELDKMMN